MISRPDGTATLKTQRNPAMIALPHVDGSKGLNWKTGVAVPNPQGVLFNGSLHDAGTDQIPRLGSPEAFGGIWFPRNWRRQLQDAGVCVLSKSAMTIM